MQVIFVVYLCKFCEQSGKLADIYQKIQALVRIIYKVFDYFGEFR